jgi:hypothetical protein
MVKNRDEYIPALKYDWLTPLYDPLIRWTLRESTFKRRLLQQARVEKGHRVLDLGAVREHSRSSSRAITPEPR